MEGSSSMWVTASRHARRVPLSARMRNKARGEVLWKEKVITVHKSPQKSNDTFLHSQTPSLQMSMAIYLANLTCFLHR